MATISILSRLVNGVQRQVNLSSNILWVQDLQLNNSSGWTLAGTTSGHAGSTLIGDDNTYTNITPSAATVKGALQGIDTAIGAAAGSGANKTLSNLTNPTAVNQSLIPAAANTQALGTAASYWGSSYISKLLDTSSVTSVDPLLRGLYDVSGNVSVAWGARNLRDGSNLTAVDWASRLLVDSAGSTQLSWSTAGVELNSGPLNMNANQINNLAMASTPAMTDAANVNFVYAVLQGLSPKASVKAATIAALPTNTYSNGTAGVGATLTAVANGVLTVDGYAPQLNERILVKNEVAAANNGIYFVSTVGTSLVPYVLTRSLDADSSTSTPPSVASGIWTFVEATSVTLGNQGWMLTTPDPITMGTTALTWGQFFAQGEYIFGNGLTQSGVNVSVNLSATGALGFTSGAIQVIVAASGGLQITSNSLSILLPASSGLATSGTGLAIQVDGSTITINGSNQLNVPNAGIQAAQVNTNVFDQSTIVGGAGTAAHVASSPQVSQAEVAGQSFSANITYAVRYGQPANGETAGRVYAADITTSSFDLFWCIGFIQPLSAISAGNSVTVISSGLLTLLSGDTPFATNDQGTPVYLQAAGAFAPISSASITTSGNAVAKLAMVKTTTTMRVQISQPTVY